MATLPLYHYSVKQHWMQVLSSFYSIVLWPPDLNFVELHANLTSILKIEICNMQKCIHFLCISMQLCQLFIMDIAYLVEMQYRGRGMRTMARRCVHNVPLSLFCPVNCGEFAR